MLVDVSTRDVNASEFFNQLGPKDVPVSDVVEGSLSSKRDGL